MPRGDKTGPQGMGPMSGRGMGYCAGYPTPGWTNPGVGRGMGGGARMGRGGGFRARFRCFNAPQAQPQQFTAAPDAASPADELAMLRTEAERCRQTLEYIEQRMTAIDPDKS